MPGPAEVDRLVLDELPDGVVVADDRGLVTGCNRAAARLLALPAEAALGKPLADALPLHDAEGRAWWSCLRPYDGLATRSGAPERPLLLPDGRELLVTARFVRDRPLGPVVRVVVALRDAAARARHDRGRAELVATVAHELRSPLSSVKGFTTVLLAKWERFTDDQKRLMLETVEADADRVARLITDLLDVARIDADRLEVRRAPLDLPALAARQVAGLVAAGHPAERFVLDVASPLPELWADPDKIAQILGNLLENALRHGAGTVRVRIAPGAAGQASDAGTLLEVSDEGPGVPEEQRQRVFARFWRGERSRQRHGSTGLGLYIVRGLVDAHDGTIAVDSAPGGGALFRVALPPGVPPVP